MGLIIQIYVFMVFMHTPKKIFLDSRLCCDGIIDSLNGDEQHGRPSPVVDLIVSHNRMVFKLPIYPLSFSQLSQKSLQLFFLLIFPYKRHINRWLIKF